jgi:hypothetical protein
LPAEDFLFGAIYKINHLKLYKKANLNTSKLVVGIKVFDKWYITTLFIIILIAVDPSACVMNDESRTLNCISDFDAGKFSC